MTDTNEEPRRVPVGTVKVHAGLQPRDLTLLKQREQVRYEAQREQHIADMAALLKSDSSKELHPIALAEVDGVLYVVDGHHRLHAYKRAKRETIPAQVQAMTMTQASNASKLANVQFTKLEMHPEQKRNALWHHLAAITHGGTLELPRGTSQRKLEGQFGVPRASIQRMMDRLPEVDPERYPREHRDAITGWPHWRYLRHTPRNDMYQQMQPNERRAWKARKYATKLAKLWEQFDRDAIDMAHRTMKEQAQTLEDADRALSLDAAWVANDDDGFSGY